MTLPEIIPLFPLPNVVLFPRMPLPLHIFEPRYREMVRDAVRGARLVGMVLLRGEWQRDYGARPEIFAIGTVGEIAHVEELPDGRFNIVLRGLREYQIRQELAPRALYREAAVHWRAIDREPLPAGMRAELGGLARRYLERLGRAPGEGALLERGIDDETFVNFLAQHLDIDPLEKQGLLESASLPERGRRLAEVLEFHLETLRVAPGPAPTRTH